jgi:hypothetical protein
LPKIFWKTVTFILMYLLLQQQCCYLEEGFRQWWGCALFIFIPIEGGESKLGPLGTAAIYYPIVPAPGDCEDGEFGGMKIGRGNRSSRRKPAPAPLCPPQIPLEQTRAQTRAAAVGSQRLTSWAMARPPVCALPIQIWLLLLSSSAPTLTVKHITRGCQTSPVSCIVRKVTPDHTNTALGLHTVLRRIKLETARLAGYITHGAIYRLSC